MLPVSDDEIRTFNNENAPNNPWLLPTTGPHYKKAIIVR